MKVKASTIEEYFLNIPEDRVEPLTRLRTTIQDNIPKGFEETLSYGMPAFVVPHSVYPRGYHCDPSLPLPFVSYASQKNFIALYHMGIYANPELLQWFQAEYPNHSKTKLDMGKSCIRFKNVNRIPYDLIGELMQKMTPQSWIQLYDNRLAKS